MRYCQNADCSGLDPCETCVVIRRAIVERALNDADLSPEQRGKFYRAYGEAFETALVDLQKAIEIAQQRRLAEKEGREKQHQEKQKRPGVAKTASSKASAKKEASQSSVNGQHKTSAVVVEAEKNSQHSHVKE